MTEKKVDLFKLPVHPAAAIFPMLDEEELADLAEDIAENGLRQPLVIGMHEDELHLIDGRNRREGCKRAKVEPTSVMLNGEDQTAYVLSANINRRHLTTGQRAMAVAMLYPEAEKGGRGKKGLLKSKGLDVADSTASKLISQARTVLAVLPELAKQVLEKGRSLGEAYAEAIELRKKTNGGESATLMQMKQNAPDLYELFETDKMKSSEAVAAYRQRLHEAREQRSARQSAILDAISSAARAIEAFAVDPEISKAFDKNESQDKNAILRRFPDGLPTIDQGNFKQMLRSITQLQEIVR